MPEERVGRVLEAAGISAGRLVRCRALSGGTYNTVEELLLTDGGRYDRDDRYDRYVLKTPPPVDAPGLSHERDLLVAEVEFYRAAATVDVPVPRVVAVSFAASAPTGRHLLMTACPGGMWDDRFTADEQACLREELGRHVARLHRVTGPGFGYPSGALGPLSADWRSAFTAMYAAVLDDARRYGAWLPRPVDEVARTAASAYDALDEVVVPCLVHFDLWRGNIMVERPETGPGSGPESGREPRIGGLVDGERMFWGDPLADFVSLAVLDDIEKDRDFLGGYQEAGGRAEFGRSARLRLALYRSYLYLIMLIETIPRDMGERHAAWLRDVVAPELVAALDELGPLGAAR
ncbi:aminoglycoside phosphotransferase (APT) family kinase protein [Streptomyces aurantiacus]|uniref:phosphotransferase family protein n=1 Tax=Streptomyces aurantiacus TaxID=47760 RepID=UPI0027913D5C|nr:phosphotransferase [Streptomyces aurantiacus]MDQ0772586.1 aminoglycoside phosphotransferase (APT) family kinase protein [Streptomyces aurantiacus]